MRNGKWCVAGLLAVCVGPLTWGQDKVAPKTKERQAVDLATKVYDQEILVAERAYNEALEKANKKLLVSYDAAITEAMKRGGGDGLDLANELNDGKKAIQGRDERAGDIVPGLSRDKLIRSLNSKTWYQHWEQPNRDRPLKFHLEASGRDSKSRWKLELRWVLSEGGDHFLIPVDEYTLRGFFTNTGRQVGAFADKR